MNADVVQFPASPPHEDKALPNRVLAFVHESNEERAKLLPPFIKKAIGLREKISDIDTSLRRHADIARRSWAQWCRYGDLSEHRPVLSPLKLWAVAGFLLVGEIALARTFVAGLLVSDVESWLIAGAVISLTTLGALTFAHSGKQLADDHFAGLRLNFGLIVTAACGLATLVAVLAGMYSARSAYALLAEEDMDGSLINTGLTLIQVAVSCGLVGVFWLQAGHHRAEQARKHNERVHKTIENLLRKRTALSSELTRLYQQLEAQWNEGIFKYQRVIFEWSAEMDLRGVPLPEFEVGYKDFAALPPEILAPVNPLPASVHQLLTAPQEDHERHEKDQDRISGLTPRHDRA